MKKTLSIILLIILLFTMSGCGKKTDDTQGNVVDPGLDVNSKVGNDQSGLGDLDELNQEMLDTHNEFQMIVEKAAQPITSNADSGKNIIVVSNLAEFLAAIKPGATVVIKSSGLNLTQGAYESRVANAKYPYARIDWAYGEPRVIIQNVNNLVIRSEEGKKAELISEQPDEYVLNFVNCSNVTIENIIAGHDVPGYCTGGVFSIENSRDIKIIGCSLYGCGTEGLYLSDVMRLTMSHSEIYECTYGLMTIYDCDDMKFEYCSFSDTGEFDLITIARSNNITFNYCEFMDNFTWDSDYSIFTANRESSNIKVKNSYFINNDAMVLSNSYVVVFEDCVMKNNTFDNYGYFDEYNTWVVDWSYAEEQYWAEFIALETAAVNAISGTWVCDTIEYPNGNKVFDAEDEEVYSMVTFTDDYDVSFLYEKGSQPKTSTYFDDWYWVSYAYPTVWGNGYSIDWCCMFSTDTDTFQAIKYYDKLQIYWYKGAYDVYSFDENSWTMMTSYEYATWF